MEALVLVLAMASPSGALTEPAPAAGSTMGSFGSDFTVDTTRVYTNGAGGGIVAAAVARGSACFLVVWSEDRVCCTDILAARLSLDGVLLDSGGVLVSAERRFQEQPAVAFDGRNFLVVWHDYRGLCSDEAIYGARVSQDGVLLDTASIEINDRDGHQRTPAVCFDGEKYLVVWQDEFSQDICGTRVSTDGVVLDRPALNLAPAPGNQFEPALAFNGTVYLLAWRSDASFVYNIRGTRLSRDGVPLDSGWLDICSESGRQSLPAVATDGSDFLVAWYDERPDSLDEPAIYGTRVTGQGEVLDPDGIRMGPCRVWPTAPKVAFDGSDYFGAWSDERDSSLEVVGTRVGRNGYVYDPGGRILTPDTVGATFWDIVWSGTAHRLLCNIPITYGRSTLGTSRVSPEGVPLDSALALVSISTETQITPYAASNGSSYLVTWTGRYGCGVKGMLLGPNGRQLLSRPVVLDTSGGECAVASDGTDYLAVWGDGSGRILARRVSASGVLLDSVPLPVADSAEGAAVAYDGANYRVAWKRRYEGRVYCARFSPAGILLEPVVTSDTAVYSETGGFALSCDGTNAMVVWSVSFDTARIRGSRINRDGVVIDTGGFPVTRPGVTAASLNLVRQGLDYFLVWADNGNVYGARMRLDGTVLDPNPIAIAQTGEYEAQSCVTFDGSEYIVVWERWDDDNEYTPSNLWGSTVNRSGRVGEPHALTTAYGSELEPHLARGPGQQVLLVHSGYATRPYGAQRIWGRLSPLYGIDDGQAVHLAAGGGLRVQPNPFRLRTWFSCGRAGPLSLTVHSASGRLVRRLTGTGPVVMWDGTDDSGQPAAAGIYFARQASGVEHTASTVTKVVIAR